MNLNQAQEVLPQALGVVLIYMIVTAPFLALLVKAYGMRREYLKLFVLGVILQIIPIGLIYFPLGIVGVGVLAVSLHGAWSRNRSIRRSTLQAPEVIRRWSGDYILNLVAMGLALEQKAIAVVFLVVTGRARVPLLGPAEIVGSVALWALITLLVLRERQQRRRVLAALAA